MIHGQKSRVLHARFLARSALTTTLVALSLVGFPGRARAQARVLVRALDGEDALARFRAEEELVKMGAASVGALRSLALSRRFTPARQRAFNVLARIDTGNARALLIDALKRERGAAARGALCLHLGRMGAKEAVPIIGRWLRTIEGKSFPGASEPWVKEPFYHWVRHVHALRDIGSEDGIVILERLSGKRHAGEGGRILTRAVRQNLAELGREVAFRKAVRQVAGLEIHLDRLVAFFRRDDLARIRCYRDKVIAGGREGNRVLIGMRRHSDVDLRAAAGALLEHYGDLAK